MGGSFAGLAVARQLHGEVLLLDRNEIGAVQTSACGTPLWVPEAFGVADSVLQVHDKLTVRGPTRSVTYDLSAVPFCTFDYKRFCLGMLGQVRARFLRTSVIGVDDGAVVVEGPAAASGTINTVPGSQLADGETFTIGDGAGVRPLPVAAG